MTHIFYRNRINRNKIQLKKMQDKKKKKGKRTNIIGNNHGQHIIIEKAERKRKEKGGWEVMEKREQEMN